MERHKVSLKAGQKGKRDDKRKNINSKVWIEAKANTVSGNANDKLV